MSAGWPATLDGFARHLAEQRRALDAGDPDAVVAFAPPSGLGPLPAEHADRAASLLSEARALEERIRRALAATAREDALVRRFETASAVSTVFVDSTA